MKAPDPIDQGRQNLIEIAEAIGLDAHNISLEGFELYGDTLTVLEFARDDDGQKILDHDTFRKHAATYRLHPAERIPRPAMTSQEIRDFMDRNHALCTSEGEPRPADGIHEHGPWEFIYTRKRRNHITGLKCVLCGEERTSTT